MKNFFLSMMTSAPRETSVTEEDASSMSSRNSDELRPCVEGKRRRWVGVGEKGKKRKMDGRGRGRGDNIGLLSVDRRLGMGFVNRKRGSVDKEKEKRKSHTYEYIFRLKEFHLDENGVVIQSSSPSSPISSSSAAFFSAIPASSSSGSSASPVSAALTFRLSAHRAGNYAGA